MMSYAAEGCRLQCRFLIVMLSATLARETQRHLYSWRNLKCSLLYVTCSAAMQVQQALTHMMLSRLCSAFEGWRTKTAEARDMRQCLQRAVRTWQQRLQASAYAGWREHFMLKRSKHQMCAGT